MWWRWRRSSATIPWQVCWTNILSDLNHIHMYMAIWHVDRLLKITRYDCRLLIFAVSSSCTMPYAMLLVATVLRSYPSEAIVATKVLHSCFILCHRHVYRRIVHTRPPQNKCIHVYWSYFGANDFLCCWIQLQLVLMITTPKQGWHTSFLTTCYLLQLPYARQLLQ